MPIVCQDSSQLPQAREDIAQSSSHTPNADTNRCRIRGNAGHFAVVKPTTAQGWTIEACLRSNEPIILLMALSREHFELLRPTLGFLPAMLHVSLLEYGVHSGPFGVARQTQVIW